MHISFRANILWESFWEFYIQIILRFCDHCWSLADLLQLFFIITFTHIVSSSLFLVNSILFNLRAKGMLYKSFSHFFVYFYSCIVLFCFFLTMLSFFEFYIAFFNARDLLHDRMILQHILTSRALNPYHWIEKRIQCKCKSQSNLSCFFRIWKLFNHSLVCFVFSNDLVKFLLDLINFLIQLIAWHFKNDEFNTDWNI